MINSVNKENLNKTEESVIKSGRLYSLHTLERMKERHISFKIGNKKLSFECWNYLDPISNVIVVVSKESGTVVTTMIKNQKIKINEEKFPILFNKLRHVFYMNKILNDKEKKKKKKFKKKKKEKKFENESIKKYKIKKYNEKTLPIQ